MTRRLVVLVAALAGGLTGCGSITVPAAVRTSDGTAMVGTTTAAISGGTFSVATADGRLTCSGTYDALDTSKTINVPVSCSDGRYGNASVTRQPDGRSGNGTAVLSDGTTAKLAFGNNAGSVLEAASPQGPNDAVAELGASRDLAGTTASASNTGAATTSSPLYSAIGSGNSQRTYTGNCPTPESLDAAGRRCGARSAASRPGGYDGYGSWTRVSSSSGGGRSYVRGHYRNGRYVRGYYRRR